MGRVSDPDSWDSSQRAPNQYHMGQGNDSSLPPIGGPGGTLNGSKLKQSGGANNAALSVNGGGSGVHGQNSQYSRGSCH